LRFRSLIVVTRPWQCWTRAENRYPNVHAFIVLSPDAIGRESAVSGRVSRDCKAWQVKQENIASALLCTRWPPYVQTKPFFPPLTADHALDFSTTSHCLMASS
jgi:hypothetical protein